MRPSSSFTVYVVALLWITTATARGLFTAQSGSTARSATANTDASVLIASDAKASRQENLERRLEQIRSEYNLSEIWMHVQTRQGESLEAELGGAGSSDEIMIGSLTKLVTGVAIAILIQQDKLTLQSQLGELLDTYFKDRGKELDPSLREISVERLLTHTAGLKTNHASDPLNGIDNSIVFRRLGVNSTPLDYLIESGGDKSTGATGFVYSNISYLLLGLVVEAVSGESYEKFCKEQIFERQGISDARIPGLYRSLAPFAGWRLTADQLLKLLSVFDISNPTILTRETLRNTLLADLGANLGQEKNVHYTLGVYVKKSSDGTDYFLSHNGIADFFKNERTYYSYMEASYPGSRWVFVTSPAPKSGGKQIAAAIRQAVASTLADQ